MFIGNIFLKNYDKVTNYQRNDFCIAFSDLDSNASKFDCNTFAKNLEFEFSDFGGRWRRDSTGHYNRFFICFVFRFLQNNKVSYIEDGTFAHLMKNSLAL